MADLDYSDTTDFDDVDRGFVGTLDDPVITAADGHVVWDCSKYDFIQGDAPSTANPSLWRQGKLVARHGLFELTGGVYQVRGLDLSNMSLVETDSGVIVIDTLMSNETAAAALALYRKHRGDRPVKALIITHSHADHYGGSAAVADAGTPIYAPSGFLEHAVSENVYAGAAMSRRATYIYAADLPAGPAGQIGAGLGIPSVRVAPLADLGNRADHGVPDPAARHLRLYARPDPAADEPGPDRYRDRRRVHASPALESAWNTRGYYGSFSHNVKAIYQRYLGWYDGNPAHLWSYPPEQEAARYVEFMGGAAQVLDKARKSLAAGDLRWTATVTSHVVFADPGNAEARELLATALEQLGHGAENGLWRNIYLRGAEELRGPIAPPPPELASPEVLGALTIEQLFDSLSVRIDGPRAARAAVCIDWIFTDLNRTYRTELSNGALIHAEAGYGTGQPGLTITLAKPQLIAVIATGKLDAVQHEGDASLVPALLTLLDRVDHQFPIVTP